MWRNILLSLKKYWVPLCLVVFWLVTNLLLCQRGATAESVKVATPEELQIYACYYYGDAELISSESTPVSSRCVLRDIELDFEYELISEISHSNDILPYYESKTSDFPQQYQKSLISLAGSICQIVPTEHIGAIEMQVISDDIELVKETAKRLLELDSRNLISRIYLLDAQGAWQGYYTNSGAFVSQEELNQQYFDYQFQCIMQYPYTYQFLYSETVPIAQVPGVNLEDVYAYYESCSEAVPTSATLYWFEVAYSRICFIASLKGMNAQGKYYTNFDW